MNWKQRFDIDVIAAKDLATELKQWRDSNSTNTERARLLAKQLELTAQSLYSSAQSADIDKLLKEQQL